jgi:tRNA threonylcarbamoyladenosine modification (KEOPS) complex Cgi121 subunit
MGTLAYRIKLQAMIQTARNNENSVCLYDLDEVDEEKLLTFSSLKEILEEALVNLEEEKNHIHDYNTENGICSGCGMDGNA